jgi:hypothetical protein
MHFSTCKSKGGEGKAEALILNCNNTIADGFPIRENRPRFAF